RDLVRTLPAGPAPRARAADPAIGMASTVETAVGSAVAATLEQIRLAFRGRHPTEPAGAPEQVLWNRLMTTTSGGVLPAGTRAEALGRWRAIHARLRPELGSARSILCAGATPWPLVAALAGEHASVVLVERSRRAAKLARADLAALPNVSVVRHD